jgi:hypothetical protein
MENKHLMDKTPPLKFILFFAIILSAIFFAEISNKRAANQKNNIITFVANSETRGDGLKPSTMDHFNGTQYPHLSLLIPYLKKHNQAVEVVDWEDETIDWLTKDKVILGPVWGCQSKVKMSPL